MSVRVMHEVWDRSQQSGSALLMLLAIADNANDECEAWPAVSTLAKKCRMTERNARMLLRQLVEAGELEIQEGAGAQTRYGNTNLYIIRTPGIDQPERVKRASGVKATSGVKPKVSRGEKSGTQGVKPASGRTIIEPSGTKNDDDARVRERLTAIFTSADQADTAIAAAVRKRGYFSLADADLCEHWLDVQRPEWSGKVGSLYKTLKAGDLPILPRANGHHATQPILTMADVKRQSAEMIASDPEMAALMEEIRSGSI